MQLKSGCIGFRRFSVTTLAFTAPGTLSHAVYIKYLKLGSLKVPKAVTTTQVVVTAGVVSEVSRMHVLSP